MTVPSIAIEPYVVKAQLSVPDGFATIRTTLTGALPAKLALDGGWSLVLHVPTGSARVWLDADPGALVTSSELEYAGEPTHRPPPARLTVLRDGVPVGSLALTIGVITRLSSTTPTSATLAVMPIAWEIRAGAVVGAPTSSTRLELAWLLMR